MAILNVAQMGHPILLKSAQKIIDPTEPSVARLAMDMQETIENCGANGIAGPRYTPLKAQLYFGLHRGVFRQAQEQKLFLGQ